MYNFKNLSYQQCVFRGKQLVEKQRSIKYEICELALHVCTLNDRGGKFSTDYTVGNFARDIGLTYSQVRQWLDQHRKVVKKIGIINPQEEDYKIIREVVKHVKVKTPKREVKKIYNKVKKYKAEDYVLIEKLTKAKGLRNFAYEYDLTQLNKENVEELIVVMKAAVKAMEENLKSGKTGHSRSTSRRYTKEDIEYLKKMAGKMPIEKLAKKLNKTERSIHDKASRMGISVGTKSIRFSAEEESYIRKMAGKKSASFIAKKLNKPEHSIKGKASRMGVSLRVNK